ncbi:UNVERIFIED_CONTAM: ParB family chromosome partitioning protein [Acetivibrio alkalicellulosi]
MSERKLMSLEDMFGENSEEINNEKEVIEITKLEPFEKHPFKLYEGERFENMVRSIKELGIIVPVIVRPKGENYQILSGHNRVNAAKKAGINKVPVIIKDNINDEEAMLIVTETNLMQRSFSDMLHSERAASLTQHHKALSAQGKRIDLLNDIKDMLKSDEIRDDTTSCHSGTKLRSNCEAGKTFNLSGRTVSRYLRVYQLIKELKDKLDIEEIPLLGAVELSYLNEVEQQLVDVILSEHKFKVDVNKTKVLRDYSQKEKLDEVIVFSILSGDYLKKKKSIKPTPIKLKPKLISKYFKPETKPPEIEEIIDKALNLYFETHGKEELNE